MSQRIFLVVVMLACASSAIAQSKPDRPLVTVAGQAEIMVVPDEVIFNLVVEHSGQGLWPTLSVETTKWLRRCWRSQRLTTSLRSWLRLVTSLSMIDTQMKRRLESLQSFWDTALPRRLRSYCATSAKRSDFWLNSSPPESLASPALISEPRRVGSSKTRLEQWL